MLPKEEHLSFARAFRKHTSISFSILLRPGNFGVLQKEWK